MTQGPVFQDGSEFAHLRGGMVERPYVSGSA